MGHWPYLLTNKEKFLLANEPILSFE